MKANCLDVIVLNAGKSRDTSAQVLARLDAAVPAGTSIVLLGAFIINDHRMGISPAASGANMAMMRWILFFEKSNHFIGPWFRYGRSMNNYSY